MSLKKTLLSVFVSSVLFPFSLAAYQISFEPKISYSNEFYSDFFYTEDDQLKSRLDYCASFLFKTGLETGITFSHSKINFCFLTALPFRCGTLYDNDWKVEGLQTDRSFHNLRANLTADFSLEYKFDFPLSPHINLSPAVNVSYSFRDFGAEQGIAYKGTAYWTGLDKNYSWDSGYAVQKKVYGIGYTSNIFSIYTGFESIFSFSSHDFIFDAMISPFSYCFATDHHLNADEGHWYQMIQTGFFTFYDISAFYSYSFTNESKIALGIDLNFSTEMPGEFYYGYFAEEADLSDEKSALAVRKFSFTISYVLK